jgi:CTP:molybdopterin cytidylyltransferase MocA
MVGGAKLLSAYRDGTVIAQVVSTARVAGLDPVVVVVRQDDRDLPRSLEGTGVRFAAVRGDPEGRLRSVVAGVAALNSSELTGAVILLGDEPGLSARHIRAVCDAAGPGEEAVLRARFRDRPGHPVYLPNAVLRSVPDLACGFGPSTGLWNVIVQSNLPHRCVPIGVVSPIDVDTRDDLARAVNRATLT